MIKIIEYKIVVSRYQIKLIDMINNMIDDGWEPYGNLIVSIDPITSHTIPNEKYYQPMVMYDEGISLPTQLKEDDDKSKKK